MFAWHTPQVNGPDTVYLRIAGVGFVRFVPDSANRVQTTYRVDERTQQATSSSGETSR
jgi:hypothetical protein